MYDEQITKFRKEERDQENKNKKAKRAQRNQINSDDLFEASSTFRIFSRASCNFTFPNPPQRPRPTKKKIGTDSSDDAPADNDVLDEKSIEGTYEETIDFDDVRNKPRKHIEP